MNIRRLKCVSSEVSTRSKRKQVSRMKSDKETAKNNVRSQLYIAAKSTVVYNSYIYSDIIVVYNS